MEDIDKLPEPHPWPARVFLPFVRGFVWSAFAVFGGVSRWTGSRRVPRVGPLLVIVNHQSNTDPLFVQLVCPRVIHFLARRQLWEWGGAVSFMVRYWRAIPISQATADRTAIKNALELLRQGQCVGIFPEGQLSPDGKLIDLFPGVAMIIRRAKVPCICLGIQNTRRVMPDPEVTPRWAGCWVKGNWGEVRTFADDTSTDEIMEWVRSELTRLSQNG